MKHLVLCSVLSALLLIVEGCPNNTPTESTPVDRAYGRTTLQQEDMTVMADNGGVSVVIEGTTLRTTTDHNGNWSIANPPHHSFAIAVSKPGFGVNKFYFEQYSGGSLSDV